MRDAAHHASDRIHASRREPAAGIRAIIRIDPEQSLVTWGNAGLRLKGKPQ